MTKQTKTASETSTKSNNSDKENSIMGLRHFATKIWDFLIILSAAYAIAVVVLETKDVYMITPLVPIFLWAGYKLVKQIIK